MSSTIKLRVLHSYSRPTLSRHQRPTPGNVSRHGNSQTCCASASMPESSSGAEAAQQWISNWKLAQRPSQFRLWMMCIKPPMYSVAVVPVAIGAALAYFATGVWLAQVCSDLMLGSVLIIAWLNLSNDAFDSSTGVDSDDRKPESIVNLTGADWRVVFAASMACLAAGLAKLAAPLAAIGSPLPAYLLLAAIVCGYVYQGPPFRLSYRGLGEPLCFLAFGPLATTAFFLCHAMPAAPQASALALLTAHAPLLAIVSTVIGLTTTSILFCSHFHQIAGDRASGKMGPLVRLGTRRATQVLQVGSVIAHLLALNLGLVHPDLAPLSPLGILAAPAALSMANFAGLNHGVPSKIKPLKLYAIKWHCAFGAALFLILFVAGVSLHGADSLV